MRRTLSWLTSAFLRLAVVVSDLEQSKRFYTCALGYRIQFEGDIGRPIVKRQLGLDADQTVSFVVLVSDNVIDGQQLNGAMLGLLQIGDPAPPVMLRPDGIRIHVMQRFPNETQLAE